MAALANDTSNASVSTNGQEKKQKEDEKSIPSEDMKSNATTTKPNVSPLDTNTNNQNHLNHLNDDDEHKSIDDVPALKLLDAGQLRQHEIEHFSMKEEEIQEKAIPLSWSNCDATSFNVRRGPNYVSGQKSPSKKALYTIFAVDAYTTSQKIHKIWEYVDIGKHIKKHATPYHEDKFPLPPLFIMNVMIPNYTPELMNGKSDGEGMSVIIYAHISSETRAQLDAYSKDPNNNSMRPAVDLLQRFIHSDLVHSEIRNRFKCIVRLMNPKHTDFGFIANRLVTRYNAKPFLARTSSTFYHEPGQYFAADIDIHVFGYPARQGLNYVKSTLQTAVYDLGMTVEGHSNDELPEQILACGRISKMGFDVCKPFPEHYMKHFIDRAEQKERDHHDKSGPRRSESTGDLLKNGKQQNGKKMPPHSQSARNAFVKTQPMNGAEPDNVAEKETENKKKGDKANSGSWGSAMGSVFTWGK